MNQWNQFNFQDSYSSIMEELMYFHDFVMLILVFTMSVVGAMLISMGMSKWSLKGLVEGQTLECVWTLVPAVLLVLMAIPSLGILYSLEETCSPGVTLKVVGHQWYWSYELSDFFYNMGEISMDSYMTPLDAGSVSLVRLLETDNCPALPYGVNVRGLITSADVLHSWSVPSLGVKMDACPGRLNQISFFSDRPGVVYGQCSEICGANHSFMPIMLEFVSPEDFISFVYSESN